MKSWFSFQGSIGPRSYLLASMSLLLLLYSLHGVVLTLLAVPQESWGLGFWFLLARFPPSMFVFAMEHPAEWSGWHGLLLASITLVEIAIAWLLASLAVRRARSAGRSRLAACLAVVPIVQILVITELAMQPAFDASVAGPARERVSLAIAFKGLVAGLLLTLALTALITLVFSVYGFGLFLASPFVVGCATGYIGNRHGDIGQRATTRLVFGACFLGSIGQLAVAIEGVICLVMAAPLIALMAWPGGLVGRAIALKGVRAAPGSTAMSIAVVPLFLALDLVMPPRAAFETVESIEVAATEQEVWDSIVHMGPIPEPPIAPFRWGLAYPVSGTIQGSGVGAIREGVFSTGIAHERVTVWEPGKRLEFIVLSDPPSMRELSPYREVHAPHVNSYFRTLDARFAITPLANGRTRLSLATRHELDLNPAIYWMPWAKWAVHANKKRVLQHFAQQAEAAAAGKAAGH